VREAVILTVVLALFTSSAVLGKQVQVKGYSKRDGSAVFDYEYTKTVNDKDSIEVACYMWQGGIKVQGYHLKKKGG
jgi:hypothetical protein